jgi:hypothetical protein
MVQFPLYGTFRPIWYISPYMVQFALYGTVPPIWYSSPYMVQFPLYGTVPPIWYSSPYMVQFTLYGTVHPIRGHEDPEGEWSHSSTLSLTSALDGMGGQRHTPSALTPGKTRYPLYRRLGRTQDRSGWAWRMSPPTGIRSTDRPARSESLYRLRYPKFVYTAYKNEHLFFILKLFSPKKHTLLNI